jgi:hypothetical protein
MKRDDVAPLDDDARQMIGPAGRISLVTGEVLEVAGVRVRRRRVECSFGRALDVVGRELGAVLHRHAGAQDEAIRLAAVVDVPVIRQIGHDARVLVVVDEPGEHEVDRADGEIGAGGRVDAAPDVADRREVQRPAAERRRGLVVRRCNGIGETRSAPERRGEQQGRRDRQRRCQRVRPREDRAHRAGPPRAC